MLEELRNDLKKKADKKKAAFLSRFFKTGEGEYGQGDVFLGLTVPESRKLAKKYENMEFGDLEKLLASKFHEERIIALFILVSKFQKGTEAEKEKIYNFYIKNRKGVNNWDLVDLSAPKIAGQFLENKDKSILYKFAESKNIWERRISILSTFYFIYKGDCKDALKIAYILKDDKHDLIQKAVGWMLREVGKRCSLEAEEEFLKKYHKTMPRTMLRYAIEKFSPRKRKYYLNKE